MVQRWLKCFINVLSEPGKARRSKPPLSWTGNGSASTKPGKGRLQGRYGASQECNKRGVVRPELVRQSKKTVAGRKG